MVTFLASPKSFVGVDDGNQRRAIRSWLAAAQGAEVILYGASQGVSEAARELGVRHVSRIRCNQVGLPYFNAIVEHAAEHGQHARQVYLNCDILLPPYFGSRLKCVDGGRSLIVGQRIDLAAGTIFYPEPGAWDDSVGDLIAAGKASLHPPSGIDYFVFERGMWHGLPNVLIGRGGYDSALLAYCLRRRIPVYDASRILLVVHQYHDYAHVGDGQRFVFAGPEAQENLVLNDIVHSAPMITDADYQLHEHGVTRNWCRGDWLRFCEMRLRYRLRMKHPSYAVRLLWRLVHGCPGQAAKKLTQRSSQS